MFYYDNLPGTGDYSPPEPGPTNTCDQCGGIFDNPSSLTEQACGDFICEICEDNNNEIAWEAEQERLAESGPAPQPQHKTDFGYVK